MQPKNKLHVFSREKMNDVIKEFLSASQEKPLVVFYNKSTDYINPLEDLFEKQAEQAFELGSTKELEIKPDEESAFESKIETWSELPYSMYLVRCQSEKDEALRLACKLAEKSGKHVAMLVHETNAIEDNHDRKIRYRDGAAKCFATWQKHAFFAVADNNEGLYKKNRQLFLAYHQAGILDFIKGTGGESTEEMGKMLNDMEALKQGYTNFVERWAKDSEIPGAKLFQVMWMDDEIKIDKRNGERWQISLNIENHRIDRELLKSKNKEEPKLAMWVKMNGNEMTDCENGLYGFRPNDIKDAFD